MLSIAFVLGTRPEIIKLAPVILEVEKRKIKHTIIHTGQHYDKNLSDEIFDSLDISPPDINLEVRTKIPHKQLSEMIAKIGETILELNPSIVLAVGDTVSVLASGLSCIQNAIPFGHIEAGLRSYDFTMPEEINRRLVDHISSILFAPSERAVLNLNYEGIDPKRIYHTGNTVIDSIRIFDELIHEKKTVSADNILEEIKEPYILTTIHRIANVENKTNLEEIVKTLVSYNEHSIVLLIHPRTRKKLEEHDLLQQLSQNKKIHLYSPVEYSSLLKLLKHERCLLVLTDSGGLQEEASFLRKPCITIRPNTERPETVEQEINFLVKTRASQIIKTIKQVLSEDFEYRFNSFGSPYGKGYASQKIIDLIEANYKFLSHKPPENYRSGSKSFHILELGVSMEKDAIEEQFRCQLIAAFDENGHPKLIKDKLKKGDRIRILRD